MHFSIWTAAIAFSKCFSASDDSGVGFCTALSVSGSRGAYTGSRRGDIGSRTVALVDLPAVAVR